jgi:N-acylneuraminate cytidylyltransferase
MRHCNIAIIPARGGSKRIPKKNIKPFLGKPIIEYSIATALASKLFERVIVSTDDEEIAKIATSAGAEVPFMRSKENSSDFAGTTDVLFEVINRLEQLDLFYKYLCCLYPTSPFVTPQKLEAGYKLLLEGYDTVFPVCLFSYPILRALQINDQRKVEMIWPENLNKRSQDIAPAYHDAGQFYWANTEAVMNKKSLLTGNSASLILSELEVQDIDNETDWKLAELKYQLLEQLV